MSLALNPLDLCIVLAYLVGVTLFGLRFRKTDASVEGYFLAGRDIPWWAIALSVVAAETSTLTIISIPGLAYSGDFGFLQLAAGYLLGRVVICILFLPRYFRGEMLTAYQLIGQRFGPRLHKATALLFLLSRALAEGVRVFAISIVVGLALGTNDITSIAIITLITLIYTFEGGLRAVIWTDVVQVTLYVLVTIGTALILQQIVPGGWSHIFHTAQASQKMTLFHLSGGLSNSYTLWAGLLGGCFLTMASHGTDQLMVQRLLAARSLKAAQGALLSSGVIVFVQFALFLLIGSGLWVFHHAENAAQFGGADRIFPLFIVQQLPIGIRGIALAAVLAAAMSNLSAALNSLASTSLVDFYLPARPETTLRTRTKLSRWMTLAWAIILFLLATVSRGSGHVVEIGLSIASVTWGAMLGVFLLGTLTKKTTETGALIGLVAGLLADILLWKQTASLALHLGQFSFLFPKIAFIWLVLVGAGITFFVGYAASLYGQSENA